MTNNETKKENLLKRLAAELEEKKTASRYLEDEKRLTVLLTWRDRDEEIFGDIYFVPDSEPLSHLVLCSIGFELMDASKLAPENLADLLVGCTMIGSAIPFGGFGVEYGVQEAPEGSEAAGHGADTGDNAAGAPPFTAGRLIYRMDIPFLATLSEEQMYDGITTVFYGMASVLRDAVGDLISLAEGKLSREDFLARITS